LLAEQEFTGETQLKVHTLNMLPPAGTHCVRCGISQELFRAACVTAIPTNGKAPECVPGATHFFDVLPDEIMATHAAPDGMQ
jgi:hypothetical protein